MATITLDEARANLAELIHRLAPGEGVTITENDRPVARLVVPLVAPRHPPRHRPPVTGVPRAGAYEGRLVVPDDFKGPLEEMREYIARARYPMHAGILGQDAQATPGPIRAESGKCDSSPSPARVIERLPTLNRE